MKSADVCRNFVRGIGRFFGSSLIPISTIRKAVGKSILTNIFKQNVAIHKLEFVDTAVG
jgi:hypothetical protein